MTSRMSRMRALAWKEWRENRWKFFLSVIVLAVLSGSLIRAQMVTTAEAMVIVFGPLGLVLSIFVALGPVPPEKSQGTWPFLLAQPVRRVEILTVKWAMGALSIIAALVLAGFTAYAAAASRGLFDLQLMPQDIVNFEFNRTHWLPRENTPQLLTRVVISACFAFVAFYSLLFWAMVRASNELHAGLAGILLTLLVIAWSIQYPVSWNESNVISPTVQSLFWFSSLISPLAPLLFVAERAWPNYLLGLIVAPMLWIGLPIAFWWHQDRRGQLR